MKPALLVIDIQNEFFNHDQACDDSLKFAVANINAAIDLFREKTLPIVVIQHMNKDLAPGKPGFDVHDSVKLKSQDLRIVKTHRNSFRKTRLAEILRELGVDTVIVTGYSAEYCVLSTYRGAQSCGFATIMLKGSIASKKAAHIRSVEKIAEATSFSALETLLDT
ncbi:MAG: isochorismatase family protein [Candidatus Bathyarchaeota archaeon]|nr:MAG: isochorismatase family protein [Candidatus Bathyarchaeota archaeon]